MHMHPFCVVQIFNRWACIGVQHLLHLGIGFLHVNAYFYFIHQHHVSQFLDLRTFQSSTGRAVCIPTGIMRTCRKVIGTRICGWWAPHRIISNHGKGTKCPRTRFSNQKQDKWLRCPLPARVDG